MHQRHTEKNKIKELNKKNGSKERHYRNIEYAFNRNMVLKISTK